MSFSCPHCGTVARVGGGGKGSTVTFTCQKCKARITVANGEITRTQPKN
jgi:transposase-like protein